MSYLAIVLAAGKSTRMGGKINKPFCEIGKEKLIIHLIDLILKSNFNRIIIVINSNYSQDEKDYIQIINKMNEIDSPFMFGLP